MDNECNPPNREFLLNQLTSLSPIPSSIDHRTHSRATHIESEKLFQEGAVYLSGQESVVACSTQEGGTILHAQEMIPRISG